jgi:hypothetical protein
MFHSFYVMVNDAVIEAEEFKKIGEQFVPMGNLAGQGFTGCGQNEAAIFFVFEETLGIQSLHHVRYAGLGNFQRGCDIDHASIALGINQFEDAFEVILDRSRIARWIGFARHGKKLIAITVFGQSKIICWLTNS